ncbi:NAD(P)H-binding protein [Nocardia uniformis]|uniref:NAD(P)H-binding protein n=1 Tax=Nocardia uniformis TaxID=53432 RepID=A0A849CA23_9NOCA|nr:NAD(P)H-binding protein [Nocardia uniformis]NNH74696.1 NAD(P)H-binding protein [Nocardia uniformis]
MNDPILGSSPGHPILVTGAGGGSQGATGRMVSESLVRAGLPVRAFVHRDDARTAELKDLGAEIVVGDLREVTAVRPAVQGVRRAYFTYPVTAGMLDAAAVFATSAHEAGVQRVVAVSQLGSDPNAGTPHMRRHWVAEQVLDRAEVGAVHLRAAVFFDNLRVAIGDRGELALPLGSPETVLPLIAAADVAAVGAGVLRAEGPVDPVLWLAGEIMTVGQAADAFGVPYVPVDPDDYARTAMSIYRDEVTVEHLTHLWTMFAAIGSGHELFRVTETIEQFTGRPPLTLRDYTGIRPDADPR